MNDCQRETLTPNASDVSDTNKPSPQRPIDVASLSDVGYSRANNEDSFGFDLETNVFVVCDGMGGSSAGEIASKQAVETTLSKCRELLLKDAQPEAVLLSAIAAANHVVWSMSEQDQALRGMGTTLVAACVRGSQLVIGNVGDSRAYLLRGDECVQITEDHSYVAEQVHRGSGAVDRGISARFQQYITRAVGVWKEVRPDFFFSNLEPGDIVLLATDGLTRYTDADRLAEHIAARENLEATCRSLITIAHQAGAEDNITCLLLRV